MSDHDPTRPSSSAQTAEAPGGNDDLARLSASERNPDRRRRRPHLDITQILIVVLLAIGVSVLALDMKFQADQARWQQRQTCLEWYRLQADYGVGPWYQKLPAAAADCGGAMNDAGDPLVPGGTGPAVEPGETRYVPTG